MNTLASVGLGRATGISAGGLQSRVLLVRGGAVLLQSALLVIALDSPGNAEVQWLMTAGIGVAALASLVGLQQMRTVFALDDAAVCRHVLTDVALLTYLLALAGGPGNPFHDAFFLPVALAAASLPARLAWLVSGASLVCYTALQFFHVPLRAVSSVASPGLDLGEWITHAVLTALATQFLSQVRTQIKSRERQLASVREAASRAECAVAIGSIAAGAAHELATPITTISTALEDLRGRHHADPDLRRSIAQMEAGVAECRRALTVLRQAREQRAVDCPAVPVREFVGDVLNHFMGMKPDVTVTRSFDAHAKEPMVVADLALQQAVINLLTNAAQVSPDGVMLHVSWDEDELSLRVSDRGPGIPRHVLPWLGSEVFSSKPGGNGLGLFLTQVTAQRLGGRFRIDNAEGGGAVAEIVLPLALLRRRKA